MPTKDASPTKVIYKNSTPKRMHIQSYDFPGKAHNIDSATIETLIALQDDAAQGLPYDMFQKAVDRYCLLAGTSNKSVETATGHKEQIAFIMDYLGVKRDAKGQLIKKTKDTSIAQFINDFRQSQLNHLAECAKLFDYDREDITGKDNKTASFDDKEAFINAFIHKYDGQPNHNNTNHSNYFSFASGMCYAMRFLKDHSRDVSLFAFLAYQNHLFDTDDIVFSPNYAHISGMLETLFYVGAQKPDLHYRRYAGAKGSNLYNPHNLVLRDYLKNSRVNQLYQIMGIMEKAKEEFADYGVIKHTPSTATNRFYLYATLSRLLKDRMNVTASNKSNKNPPVSFFNLMPPFLKLLSRNHYVVKEILLSDIDPELPQQLQNDCMALRLDLMQFKHTNRIQLTNTGELKTKNIAWRWYEKIALKYEHMYKFLKSCSDSLRSGMGANFLGFFKIIPWIALKIIMFFLPNPTDREEKGSLFKYGFGMRKPARLKITADKMCDVLKSKALDDNPLSEDKLSRVGAYLNNFSSNEETHRTIDHMVCSPRN